MSRDISLAEYDGLITGRRRLQISEYLIPGAVAVADMASVMAVSTGIFLVYLGWAHENRLSYFVSVITMIALMASFFRQAGLYKLDVIVAWPRASFRLVSMLILSAIFLVAVAFAFKMSDDLSRVWLTMTVLGSLLSVWMLRGCIARFIWKGSKHQLLRRRIAIVGASDQASRLIARLSLATAPWHSVVGLFDERRTRIEFNVGGYAVLGTLDDLIAFARRGEIQDVVVAIPWSAESRLINIILRLQELPVQIYLSSNIIGDHFPIRSHERIAGMQVFQVAGVPFSGWKGLIKTAEDKILASLLLVFFGPLMLLIALAIKLDSPGPVLFRQKRYGFNNEIIEVLKFRTMYHNQRDELAETLVTRNDPRVTRLGALLRRTSLDELPQLLNVLRGDMALVGPRPHAIRAKACGRLYAEIAAQYAARHKVKPGLTGWAQVNGWRGETDSEEKLKKRVEFDLYYLQKSSLRLDIKILVMTIFTIWPSRNAY